MAQLQRRLRMACPADVHASWWDQVLPQGVAWRPTSAQAQHVLVGRLLAPLPWAALVDARAPCPPLPEHLLSLAPNHLSRVIEYVGIVLAGSEVRHAISQSDALAYRQALGAARYEFAVRGASLLRGLEEPQLRRRVGALQLPAVCQSFGLRALAHLADDAGAVTAPGAVVLPAAGAEPPAGSEPGQPGEGCARDGEDRNAVGEAADRSRPPSQGWPDWLAHLRLRLPGHWDAWAPAHALELDRVPRGEALQALFRRVMRAAPEAAEVATTAGVITAYA